MISRRMFVGAVLTTAAMPLLSNAQCCAKTCPANGKCCDAKNAKKLKATGGATITESDEKKTTFTIKCTKCGFVSKPITIDTPTADKPYTLEWKCPKCGNRQTVTIEVA